MCAESVESLPYPIYANRSAHVNDSNLLIIAQTRASPAGLLQPKVSQSDAWTASFRCNSSSTFPQNEGVNSPATNAQCQISQHNTGPALALPTCIRTDLGHSTFTPAHYDTLGTFMCRNSTPAPAHRTTDPRTGFSTVPGALRHASF